MRRSGAVLAAVALSFSFASAAPLAAGCAATPDLAVLQAVGSASAPARQTGFRVRDILFDAVLRRAFAQVEDCAHPEHPLVLLSFATALPARVTPGLPPRALVPSVTSGGPPVPTGTVVAVLFRDEHVRVTVEGRLIEGASVGSEVDVELSKRGQEQGSTGTKGTHVRGRLIATDRVEVER